MTVPWAGTPLFTGLVLSLVSAVGSDVWEERTPCSNASSGRVLWAEGPRP